MTLLWGGESFWKTISMTACLCFFDMWNRPATCERVKKVTQCRNSKKSERNSIEKFWLIWFTVWRNARQFEFFLSSFATELSCPFSVNTTTSIKHLFERWSQMATLTVSNSSRFETYFWRSGPKLTVCVSWTVLTTSQVRNAAGLYPLLWPL